MANNKRGYQRKAYTTLDIRYIRENIVDLQLKQIAEFLGRSRQSLYVVMKKMGIKKEDE